jgi:glycosyltransferase involved in cell wall biosynthesis
MFAKKTTLIIPTRNRPYFLLKLLKNLKNFKIKFKEIIIIDSSNKEIKIKINNIIKNFNCKIYHSKPSTSLQRNIGLKNKDKRSKYVMFLDDDIIFKKNSFLNLNNKIVFHEKNKSKILGYGFNQNKKTKKNLLENIKKSKISKVFGLYSKKDGIVMSSGWQTKILNIRDDTLTEWIPTGAVVFPSKVLNIKFDENFGKYSYLEDLDFSLNLRKKNYKNKFLIVANAIFFHPNDIERINFNFGLIEILNRFLIVRKYKLNIFYFFYMSFVKSLMTLLMSLKNIKNMMKFFGNIIGILLCLKKLIFY